VLSVLLVITGLTYGNRLAFAPPDVEIDEVIILIGFATAPLAAISGW